MTRIGLNMARSAIATDLETARAIASRNGYPVIVRPSFVLGGRAMKIAYEPKELETFVRLALDVSSGLPALIDKFLKMPSSWMWTPYRMDHPPSSAA
ncbi:MAG: hypothetical protein Q7U40_03185 [Desulfatirhabdiaceae bacterium]|nr:hypothetical protein [Desulfatirhabdiaceae bacterium]